MRKRAMQKQKTQKTQKKTKKTKKKKNIQKGQSEYPYRYSSVVCVKYLILLSLYIFLVLFTWIFKLILPKTNFTNKINRIIFHRNHSQNNNNNNNGNYKTSYYENNDIDSGFHGSHKIDPFELEIFTPNAIQMGISNNQQNHMILGNHDIDNDNIAILNKIKHKKRKKKFKNIKTITNQTQGLLPSHPCTMCMYACVFFLCL